MSIKVPRLILVSAAGWMLAMSSWVTSRGDTYTQETAATIGNITSQTVATVPADRTRTTVGIGEQVTCSIDPGTWVDKDCNTTTNAIEDDTIGDRQWSAAGAGTISPTTAGANNSATLTAHHSPGTVSVEVNVLDSQTKYNDTVTKSKSFTVIAPTGETTGARTDAPYGVAGPPNNTIGAHSTWLITVQPATVSFANARLREHIPNDVTWNWPNGTSTIFTKRTLPIPVNANNQFNDEFGSGTEAIGRINNGMGFVNHSNLVSVPRQYQNQSGLWTGYTTIQWKAEYRGADQQARTHFASSAGSWQGPYR